MTLRLQNRPETFLTHSMSLIPYKKGDLFSINVLFWCDTLECHTAFMACPACHWYPCDHLTAQDINMLKASPLMRVVSVALISSYQKFG
jgi:hypothetical protein